MNCPHCQRALPPNANVCSACGAEVTNMQPPPAAAPQTVNTWLVPSIFATLCCCLPFGIVAIIFASKANSFVAMRDYENARKAAASAKMWFWIAFGLGLVGNSIYALIQILASIAENS